MESEEPSLFVYGQEKTLETVKLAKMNIAVNVSAKGSGTDKGQAGQ